MASSSGVEGKKAQLLQQGHGAVFHTAEQVCQIAVVIIVNFQAALSDRAPKGDRSTAAEYVDKARVPWRCQLLDQTKKLSFTAYPRDKWLGNVASPTLREAVQ